MFAAGDKNSVKAKWFALRVKSKHEKKAADLLEYSGFEAFLPISRMRHRWSQRWKEVDLPLFPGYVFARFDRGGWARVVSVPGVIDAVRFGKALAAVEEKEIEALQLVQRTGCLFEPCAYYPAGHRIRIVAGPLSGLTGNVVEDQGFAHVILSVTLLQRSVRVKIDREFVLSDALPASGDVAPPALSFEPASISLAGTLRVISRLTVWRCSSSKLPCLSHAAEITSSRYGFSKKSTSA